MRERLRAVPVQDAVARLREGSINIEEKWTVFEAVEGALYMHAYIHTDIHTDIQAYIMYMYMYACTHTCIHTLLSLIHTFLSTPPSEMRCPVSSRGPGAPAWARPKGGPQGPVGPPHQSRTPDRKKSPTRPRRAS